MRDTVRLRYEAMVRAGEIAPDALQGALVDDLDAISDSLSGTRKPGKGVAPTPH